MAITLGVDIELGRASMLRNKSGERTTKRVMCADTRDATRRAGHLHNVKASRGGRRGRKTLRGTFIVFTSMAARQRFALGPTRREGRDTR